jgi:predicted aspartyl protease
VIVKKVVKRAVRTALAGTLLGIPIAIAGERNIKHTPETDTDSMPRGGISITVRKGFLVLAVGQIGGIRGRQNFVVDTGTSPSVLNTRLAKRMGLEVRVGKLVAAGKPVEVEQIVLPELALGPIEVTSLRMNVMDLSPWEKDLGTEVAGLIGMDVLGRTNFRLDYEKRQLEFGGKAEEGIAVGYDHASGVALAEATLQGRRVRLIVDTGSDLVVVYGENWDGEKKETRGGVSVAGPEMVREIEKAQMLLGGRSFSGSRTYCVPTGKGVGYDGFVGVRALKLRGVSFDRERQTMYLLN